MQQSVITLGVEFFDSQDERKRVAIIISKQTSIRAVCQYKLKVIELMEAPR